MSVIQFFIFGIFFAWFTGSGKLRALITALQSTPTHQQPDAGQIATGGIIGGVVGPLGPIVNKITGQ